MKIVVAALLLLSPFIKLSAQRVPLEEVHNHMNSTVTVCGKIFNGVYLETVKNTPTLLNMGGAFPNHVLTLLIWGENLKDFPPKPETHFANKDVCVTGLVIEYRGKPEIVLKSPGQIQLQSEAAMAPTPKNTPKSPATNSPITNTNKTPVTKVADNTPKTTATNSDQQQDDIKLSVAVKLRLTPSTESPAIFTIGKGSIVTFLGASNGWSRVLVKQATNPEAIVGKEGYVRNDLLQGETITAKANEAKNTPVTEKPKAEAKPVAPKPAVIPPAQTSTSPATNTSNTKLAKDEIRLSSNVDMRAGPGEIYKVVSQVKAGTVVTVLFSSNGWSQVVLNNSSNSISEGYINNSALQ